MGTPKHPLFTDFTDKTTVQKWPASSVHKKIQEVLQDFENGDITEEYLAQFLEELRLKDEDHVLDKIDEYNEDLRLRLQKIEIAKRALEASGIFSEVKDSLDHSPSVDESKKNALNKSLNDKLVGIKDLGNAKQVSDGIASAINTLQSEEKLGTGKFQEHINSLKDIAMGLKVDHLGSTRTSLGTGVVLQGPLGEVLGLGFTKLQVEADNDGAKYITGYISTQRNELATELRATANYVKNRPQLNSAG